jgi:hypothetical protein
LNIKSAKNFPRDNAITQILKKHIAVLKQEECGKTFGHPQKKERVITIGQTPEGMKEWWNQKFQPKLP